MNDEKVYELKMIGRLNPSGHRPKGKPTPVGRLWPADDQAQGLFDAISRDFVLLAGRPLRAIHLQSKTEMDKGSFVNWCIRYGDLLLVDDNGARSFHPAGLYWWHCEHDIESRRVMTRGSFTAKATLNQGLVQ